MRDRGRVMVVWRKKRTEETDELIETETEGQLLGFETYAWQRERTGWAGDGWEGQRGVTGEEEKMTTAGQEYEIEEEEDGEEGRSVIPARESKGGRTESWGELPLRETERKKGRRRRSRRGEEGVFSRTGCHNGSWLLTLTLWTGLTHTAEDTGGGGIKEGHGRGRWGDEDGERRKVLMEGKLWEKGGGFTLN